MAENGDESDVFAIPNFWRTSKLLPELASDAPSPLDFFAKDVTVFSSESSPFALRTVAPLDGGFFKLPIHETLTTEDDDDTTTPHDDAEKSDVLSGILESDDETEEFSDIWLDPKIPSQPEPLYRSWDAFIGEKSTTTYQAMLISESGPATYDALLNWPDDPQKLKNTQGPVVDTKTYLSSLLALLLGGESVLYSKEAGNQSLKPALQRMRISGYSSNVLQGLENKCIRCGSTLLSLRAFVQSTYLKNPSRCGVALASTVSQVLQVVQEWVAIQGQNPRSLLELQRTVNAVVAILRPFKALTSQLRHGLSDEDILTLVFHQAYAVDNNEEYLRQIMREVLRRVSVPWIEFLEEWIGTRREEGLPFTKSNVGASKGFVKVEAKVSMDDFGREIEEVDFALAHEKMPQFMPEDVVETIFETGRNLRFIRSFHPEHPLAKPDVISSGNPPKAEWLYDWDAILQLEGRVAEYRNNLVAAIQSSRAQFPPTAMSKTTRPLEDDSGFNFTFFGLDQIRMEERILASIDQFAQPVNTSKEDDALSKIVRDRLFGTHKAGIEHSHSTPHWSLLPVLSFGGIASAQAQVINKETLQLLFAAHDLRGHLRLQKEFHLLGNGVFCSRLSHALFDPDIESAEKRPGVIRQGSMMGLRLGGRDTWPPASSELRLVLMGVLAESYDARNRPGAPNTGGTIYTDGTDLPGDMSFAVRDLSDEEIDKCMNPDSLEALDFLRLSYTAPPELSPIITPMNLMQYDCIFKLLLRVLRLLFVVNQLFRDVHRVARYWEDPGDASYRFVREAQHFVSSISAYFLDTGVAVPWQMFEKKLDKVQSDLDRRAMSSSSEIQSPDKLRDFHSLILDRIMHALFLRKRQQPILNLLEEIFNTILQFAKYMRLRSLGKEVEVNEELDASILYFEFKKKVQVFISVCRSLTEKARKTSDKRAEDKAFREQYGTGDDSMVAQLLVKLDMCDYYLKQ